MSIASTDLSCNVMSPCDNHLYLAFHNVFQHGSIRLDWIHDIALLMSEIPSAKMWQELVDVSVKHHIRIPVELATAASNLWVGAVITGTLRDYSTWPAPGDRELRLWKHARALSTSRYSQIYLKLQGLPGAIEMIRWGCRFIFPPSNALLKYRRSSSSMDVPLAHLRRWASIVKYI